MEADTQDQNTDTLDQQEQTPAAEARWQDSLSTELRDNQTLGKYTSAEEAHKGHLELQKTLGSDRVAWPKDANDLDGWGEVDKRRGVPETADGYNLEAVKAPEGLGVETLDRFAFQEKMKSVNASPAQANAMWKDYTDMITGSVEQAAAQFQGEVESAKNTMMQEWGEAYETKIQRGQDVIDTFSKDQDQADRLTAGLAKDPFGMQFLAKIGDMMAESNIGGFQDKKTFTYTPDEARVELDKIKASSDYRSDDDRVRKPLVDRANELMKIMNVGAQQRPLGF